MKRNILTLVLCWCLSAIMQAQTTNVESTVNLQIFYPDYSRVDLVCDKMPNKNKADVAFCCEAAFTGQLKQHFSHDNIAGDHVCAGKFHKGYSCRANTGGFLWFSSGKWAFEEKKAYDQKLKEAYMGFGQVLIIHNKVLMPKGAQKKDAKNVYRALCERDGKLCVIQSNKKMAYGDFVKSLQAYGVTHALYLDMGAGWNYAWYRDKDGKFTELFPLSKMSSNYKYRTNWVTFFKN